MHSQRYGCIPCSRSHTNFLNKTNKVTYHRPCSTNIQQHAHTLPLLDFPPELFTTWTTASRHTEMLQCRGLQMILKSEPVSVHTGSGNVANVVAATCSKVSSQQTQAHTVADLLRNAVYVNAHQFDRHSPLQLGCSLNQRLFV